jgi:hypothetical protein
VAGVEEERKKEKEKKGKESYGFESYLDLLAVTVGRSWICGLRG